MRRMPVRTAIVFTALLFAARDRLKVPIGAPSGWDK
jgi:hypothetical protein